MKDVVEKFIVLQIQTAPSRLQPACARCFLATMILQSAPSGIRAHTQHATLSTGRLWHFKTSEFRRDRNAKYAIVTRRPIQSNAKWYSFYFNESITTVLLHVISHNCSEMHRNVAIPGLIIAHSPRKHQNGHLSHGIRYLRVSQFKGVMNRYWWYSTFW